MRKSRLLTVAGGLVAAAALYPFLRRRLPFGVLLLATTLGYATHGLLDACTTFGTQLFWPFSSVRVAWNNVSVVDPLFTLPLLALVVAAALKKKPRLAQIGLAWALFYLGLGAVQHERAKALRPALGRPFGPEGHPAGYLYPHNFKGNFVPQDCLPEALIGRRYFEPTGERPRAHPQGPPRPMAPNARGGEEEGRRTMKLRATLLVLFTLPLAATLLACAFGKGAGAVERKRASSTLRPRLFVGPTFVTGDPALWEAKAVVADASGRILEVLAEVPADPSGYEVVRLEGALALPGLHDAHAHILGIGRARDSVDLVGATSVEEVVSRVEAFLKAHPDAAVVRGRGWDQSRFSENRFPTARDLAPIGDRPVFLTRVDGHAVWVNEAFLKLAGITKDTQDPDGGRIERDADGNPTGIFIDNAIDLVADKLPKPTDADYERWLVQGMNACADAGLVAVHDMGFSLRALLVLRKLDEEGRVPLRLFLYLDGSVPTFLDALDDGGFSDRVHIMGVKLFADGALGSRGAALLEPYSDDPKNRGLLLTEPKILEERVRQVHMRGKQAAIHAIGDRGNRVALEAIAGAQGDEKGRRHRIEHAQLVHPDDFEGFAKLGVVASMQPTHATSDMRWVEARIGPERLKGAYAFKTMLARGVPLAFGSDAPVESERPTFGFYAALTRQDHEGKPEGGWRPEERLSFDEALAAFTQGAAYAVHREGDLGALTPGKLLDLTVLDRDPRGEPRTWLGAKATATVIGGEVESAGGGA